MTLVDGKGEEDEKLTEDLRRAYSEFAAEGLETSPEGFPCGILRCTCEKYPKAIYANDWMFSFLGIDEDSDTWKEFIQQNVFFMVPFEERGNFKKDLQLAAESVKPILVEHCVWSGHGSKTKLIGWVQMTQKPSGEKEYIFLYIQIDQKYLVMREKRETAYNTALKAAYDAIFRIEWQEKILECDYTKFEDNGFNAQGMRIVLNTVTRERLYNMIYEEDRVRVRAFFAAGREKQGMRDPNTCENQIEFRYLKNQQEKDISLVMVDLDDQTTLLCCREITQKKYVEQLTCKIASIQAVENDVAQNVKQPPRKLAAYKMIGEHVFLEAGIDLGFPVSGLEKSEFLHHCRISEAEYQAVLEYGKVSLTDADADFGGKRIMYLIRRETPLDQIAECLLFIYTFGKEGAVEKRVKPRVRIHTFGYFDVFVDGKPIVFRYEKSKEMLAILVDRKGSFVGNPYFISCLWGDEPYSDKVRSRCRQTAYRLKETLKQYGIEDIIEKVDGHRRIISEMVDCDYFNYLSGETAAKESFNGVYMSDYSWGEETLSCLLKQQKFIGE